MAKPAAPRRTGSSSAEVPVVGAREPCPCGSGRRYKACHGRAAANAVEPFVARPFEGLAGESDWVAMREIVPAATARHCRRSGERAGRAVTLATVLPLAWPGAVPHRRRRLVGLQVPGGSGDASRDLADALVRALDAEPGTPIAAGRAARARARGCRTCSTRRRALEVRSTRGSTSGSRRARSARRGRRVDGARQRGGGPDGPADVGRGGLLVRHRRPAAHPLGAARTTRTPLLDALARLHAAGAATRWVRAPATSGRSGRTA